MGRIVNRKALFQFSIIEEFTAGIQLVGSEVKALRNGDANLVDSFCYIKDGEIFIKGLFISKFKNSSYLNHDERRDRKLLLHKREINKIWKANQSKGMTIIAFEIFEMEGRFKIKIALSKGKKLHDKRDSIKKKDIERDTNRQLSR